jgi:hypothetical protein
MLIRHILIKTLYILDNERRNMEIIENRMNDLYVRLSWSHKIQEKQADIYKNTDKVIKITRIVLASLTSSGIISILLNLNYS